MTDNALHALGLCRKAGALETGFTKAAEALEKGAPLALISADASERTANNILRIAGNAKTLRLDATNEELALALGRGFAAAAVTDANLAKLVLRAVGKAEEM